MTRSTTVDPSAVDASLHLLAPEVLHDIVGGTLAPCLVHVAARPDGIDLGVRPLEGAHPGDLLLGFTAPEDWHALGVATSGWAYDLADRATGAPARGRVHLVTIVSRSGEVVHRTHAVDDRWLAESLGDDTDVGGEQVDLLRRALDLPTADAPCGTDVFFAIEWLAAVLGDGPGAVGTWEQIADLHPARRMLRAGNDDVARDHGLVVAATGFARACPWSRLRRLVARGTYRVPDLDPTGAGWLDDGAFARFVLNRCPPLPLLRARVSTGLPSALAERVEATLGALAIPDSAWPDGPVE